MMLPDWTQTWSTNANLALAFLLLAIGAYGSVVDFLEINMLFEYFSRISQKKINGTPS